MPTLLRALILEDRRSDVELLLAALSEAGFAPSGDAVATEADFIARLSPALDVVLADYTLPQFDAMRALRLLQERGLDVPFIIVTGSISEEAAVACMKAGAADYLLKDRLARLGQAVASAMEQRRHRHNERRAEASLRASEERYRRLFEQSRDAIFLTAADGQFLDVNQAFLDLFGYSAEGLRGLNARDLYADPADRATFQQALERDGSVKDYERRLRRKDGTELDCLLTAALWRDETGTVRAYQGNIRDVTERKRLDEQLRLWQKLEGVGRLASGIAHDFNNLLTVITGRGTLLLASLKPEDPLRREVSLILKTGGRAAALTRQLLAFSRKQLLQPTVLDLNAVLAGLEPMLRRLLREDIELVMAPGPDLGRAKADESQLEQVIVNLMVNARDAMPNGGRLTLETANVELSDDYARGHVSVQPGPYVMLAVSDTGVGMDAETQAHLFEPFFTTKEPGKGTGLGLATVYGIVKQSGGNIWVYSELGHGTTFKIYLPRVEEAADAPKSNDALPRRLDGTETILLVEDEAEVRVLAREILETLGYTVLEAQHPGEALVIAERHAGPIHLLLTDVVMPRMSGRALAEQLQPLRPEMKVLYISGYTDNTIFHHGLIEPGIAFLQKPFVPDALARTVREVLDT